MTKVQQDIVCHINNVIDWTDTSVHQKVLQPLWTWFNSHIFNHARFVSQDFIRFNSNVDNIFCCFRNFFKFFFWEMNFFTVNGSHFVSNTTHRKSICTVWRD
ncbi:hypothetical protein SGADD02_00868 [Streptococcus gallolyticus]|uniref:Uncharacterized protein n=1 Tax=Streptococcus gallolyticus TaxID=315405 RepID=A0A139N3P7_9STRE|nr:hypothetical protein SGADD02_00868 [Streptococcus gallolyticus]